MKKVNLNWELGYSKTKTEKPSEFVKANVPGNAQNDYILAKNLPSPYYGLNCRDYKWMEDAWWTYTATLDFSLENNERANLIFKGIDYEYEISINGEVVYAGEGMFSTIKLDVTKYAGKNAKLEVLIYPVPKCNDNNNRSQARKSFKPCVCYGWDYHPRFVSMGIWEDAYIEIVNEVCVDNLDVSYRLNNDLTLATISVDAKINGTANVEVDLLYKGETVLTTVYENVVGELNKVIEFASPKLWNPVNYGEQNVYTLTVKTITDAGVTNIVSKQIGFRRSKLVMNEGAWDEPAMFPKGRSAAPATLEINGRRIFAKGTNWVNTDIFIGKTTEAEIRELLTLIRDANMNIIRIHGGGPVNKECFYDICDEYGIMVWQEFPLACNEYPDDDNLLKVIEKEASFIIKRLRNHPCIVLWCGGNELFNRWSRMTDQHHVLRLLGSLCFNLDRDVPFNMTSPVFGMSHGHYVSYYEETEREIITDFIESKNTAYTEFGSPSMASPEYLRAIMSEEDYNDCNATNATWVEHHAFKAWLDEAWARKPEVEYYFGGYSNVDDLANKTQFIQAMNYRSLFEEMRKQWPYCSMALNWCFNEPWPTAANNSLVSYPAIPKPSYYAVKNALRPSLASIRANKNLWQGGETYRAEVWMLNDDVNALKNGKVNVYYGFDNGEYVSWGTMNYANVDAQSNLMLGEFSFKVPSKSVSTIKIKLEVVDAPNMNSEYDFPVHIEGEVVELNRLNF